MKILILIIVLVPCCFIIITVIKFIKYKIFESNFKRNTWYYINFKGKSFSESTCKLLTELNDLYKLNISTTTIEHIISNFIVKATERNIDNDNLIDLLSMFIYRYIFRNNTTLKSKKPTDNQLLDAFEHIILLNKSGYYVLKEDSGYEFHLKYPPK